MEEEKGAQTGSINLLSGDSKPGDDKAAGNSPIRSPAQNTSSKKLLLIPLVILILIGVGLIAYFAMNGSRDEEKILDDVEIEAPATLPATSENADITEENAIEESVMEKVSDKTTVAVSVLNGTKIAGLAGSTADTIKALGYEGVTAGNADDQEQTVTIVQYADAISMELVDQIVTELEKEFDTVTMEKMVETDADYDIVITLGKEGPAAMDAEEETESAEEN